jgi:hypothetical protein
MQRLFFTSALLALISLTRALPTSLSPDSSALAAASSAILGLLSALPPASPTTSPTVDNPHFANAQYAKNAMKCVLWSPPRHEESIRDCNNVCGEAFAKATKESKVASISCIGNSNTWDRYDGMSYLAFIIRIY